MYEWLRVLYAEQASADEIVIFLLLGSAVAFVLAFLIYAIVLVALWQWRMRSTHSLWALVFPSRKRLRRYAVEYTVAATTGILLSFTVATRHAVVEAVLKQDISQVGQEAVLSALPFGHPSQDDLMRAGADSTAAREFVAWLRDETTEPVGIRADEFIRPLLNAGLVENGSLLTQAAVRGLGIETAGQTIQRILLAVAVVLLIGYAVWFGWRRVRDVQTSGSSDPEYAGIAKRLSVPAVCIPLLIISGVRMDDPDRITRSAVSAATMLARSDSEAWVDSVIVRQALRTQQSSVYEQLYRQDSSATVLFTLFGERLDSVETGFEVLSVALQSIDGRFRRDSAASAVTREQITADVSQAVEEINDLAASLEEIAQLSASAEERLNQAEDRLEAIATRLVTTTREAQLGLETAGRNSEQIADLEQALAQVRQAVARNDQARPGYLLVVNERGSSYGLQSTDGQVTRRGSGSAQLHALPPGTYVVSAPGFQSDETPVRSGDAATVTITRQIVIE